jgi:hypothetical protein
MRPLIFVSLVFLLFSCNKEGCTDVNAVNYSDSADQNDGSCHYESTIAFWFDEYKSDFYQAFDVTEFRFFVEDELVGIADINSFLVSAPACGDSGTVTYTRSLNLSKNAEFDYEITDQHDTPIQYGSWNASGNGCVVEKM